MTYFINISLIIFSSYHISVYRSFYITITVLNLGKDPVILFQSRNEI